jgi:hypothetical protein
VKFIEGRSHNGQFRFALHRSAKTRSPGRSCRVATSSTDRPMDSTPLRYLQDAGRVSVPPAPSGIVSGNCDLGSNNAGRVRLTWADVRNSTAAPRTGFCDGTYTIIFFFGNRSLTILTEGTRSESPLKIINWSHRSRLGVIEHEHCNVHISALLFWHQVPFVAGHRASRDTALHGLALESP